MIRPGERLPDWKIDPEGDDERECCEECGEYRWPCRCERADKWNDEHWGTE